MAAWAAGACGSRAAAGESRLGARASALVRDMVRRPVRGVGGVRATGRPRRSDGSGLDGCSTEPVASKALDLRPYETLVVAVVEHPRY